MLQESGIEFENNSKSKLKTAAANFPLQILFLRDDDIPECIADQIADAGIIGENVFTEKGRGLIIAEKLGFARCRLAIAIPKQMEYHSVADLQGLKIATSYPNILNQFLHSKQVSATIHEINGSVEIAPGIGLADAIMDIVNTGSTLLSNGLKEVEVVMHSQAILVQNPGLNPLKKSILDKLLFRIRAVNKAKKYKYILLNAPNDKLDRICKILPGMKSPTIMPLALSAWSSLHSVIHEDDFWENIESLKQAGAEGILVIPIEKMVI
jgi:ATP phosphoribosyltransferase